MRVSWAKWMPEHAVDDGPRETQYRALVLHTAVSTNPELHVPDALRPGVGEHFYLLTDGTLQQYLDTDRQTGHAWDANPWTVAVESQDSGVSDNPGPWTQAQLDMIDRLLRELKVPAQSLKETPSSGVGYHRQYDSWNQSGHSCPGDAKVLQVPGIIARLAAPPKGEDDMTPDQAAQLAAIDAARKDFETGFNDADGTAKSTKGVDASHLQDGRNAAFERGYRNCCEGIAESQVQDSKYRHEGWLAANAEGKFGILK